MPNVLTGGTRRRETGRRGYGHAMMETETAVMRPHTKGTWGPQEARKSSPLEPLEGQQHFQLLGFGLVDSRTERIHVYCVKTPNLWCLVKTDSEN